MKILLIYRLDTADEKNLGVIQKMNGQAKAFREFGEVELYTLSGRKLLQNGKEVKKRISYRLAAFHFFNDVSKIECSRRYDLIYIRYGLSSWSFIRMLSKLKGKIIIEMPTYPYELEFKGLINRARIISDRYWRKSLKEHIHKIVHFGPHKIIYGIPTIRMNNGIDPSLYDVSDLPFHKDRINMIAVGKWNWWHGLDRLIKGMGEYYKEGAEGKFPIRLAIIGEGPESEKLKMLRRDLKLEEYIQVHGIRTGKELEELFKEADVGIGSLGLHRIGLKEASPLKHREYAARGVIVITAIHDVVLDKSNSFLISTSDDSVIINELIFNYREFITLDKSKREIRDAIISRIGWRTRIQIIVNQLKT